MLVYVLTPVVTIPRRAVEVGLSGSIQNENPVQSDVIQRKGNLKSRRLRRPHVSMVKKAGMAKSQFRIPVPIDTSNADGSLNPESVKIAVE